MNEVDAINNPTQLFRKINNKDWKGALKVIKHNPVEAIIWISRHDDNGQLLWKYLPLHLLCLNDNPINEELFMTVLNSYPESASIPTPHDGNLPMHYLCESGCDDKYIFDALIRAYPQYILVENRVGNTPLDICHNNSRGALTKVLEKRSSISEQQQRHGRSKSSKKHGKDRRKSRSSRVSKSSSQQLDQRSDIDTVWIDSSDYSSRQQSSLRRHRSPKSTPKESVNTEGEEDTNDVWNDKRKIPKPLNQQSGVEVHDQEDNSLQTEEKVLTLTRENTEQLRFIEELTKKLGTLTTTRDKVHDETANEPLCERIMSKAEKDNVSFRTQIQKLQDEKDSTKKTFEQIKGILCERAIEMKIDPISTASNGEDDVAETLKIVLNHMDERNTSLQSKVNAMEDILTKSETELKKLESKSETWIHEKDALTRKVSKLEEDDSLVKTELHDMIEKNRTLTAINQSLQNQVDCLTESKMQQGSSDDSKTTPTQVATKKEDGGLPKYDQEQAAKMDKTIEILTEKNRTLRGRLERMRSSDSDCGAKSPDTTAEQSTASSDLYI